MKLDDTVREIFVTSCLEQLQNVEARILDLEHAEGDAKQEQITRIFRSAHSIKGDAGSMGLESISKYAHSVENVLQLMREGRLPNSQEVINELLYAFDKLKSSIQSPDLGHEAHFEEAAKRLDPLLAAARDAPDAPRPEAPSDGGTTVRTPESSRSGTAKAPPTESLATDEKIARLSVSAEQLDILVDRVGELSIAQTRLSRLAREEHDHKFLPVAEEIEALCALLRDQVLGMRMLPLEVSFAKFRRLVRDLCAELGKKAEFVMTGQNTELDKNLIEELNTPLIHLLRNAMDHGIEPPEARKKQGKPEQGRVELAANQLGGEVLIEIKDDGKGIDAQRLRRIAVEKGMLAVDAELSSERLLDLIFLPGLSTAEKVSGVSGRGVGMDAVKASVQALRGKIELHSTPGKGTTFRIQLPVSMAIIDCLRISVAGSDYFMHLDYVEECIELSMEAWRRAEGARNHNLRGEHLALICLRDFFHVEGERPETMHMVVVRTAIGRLGVVVDHVVGQQQAVLRNLGPAVGKVPGILGATVTEQGYMGLILDMPSLAQAALSEERERWR